MSAAEVTSISSEFDIFAHKPVQKSVLGTIETAYKPIAPVEQYDLEFLIPGDKDRYIRLDIQLYIRGKLVSSSGNIVDVSDHTGVTNNLLHSLFSHCKVVLNVTAITQSSEYYNYRSYLGTLLTYGTDAAATHLTNAYWYRDTGDMLPCDPTSAFVSAVTNRGFITRWDKLSGRKELQLFGRLHSDLFNVPLVLLSGVDIQIRLTKARPSLYMMSKEADSETTFKFLDAQLLVKRVKTYPVTPLAHVATLNTGALALYNMTRVQLKTFTFSAGSKSMSIDNAVLGHVPKRLLFTMVKNADFVGTIDTNPYKFHPYDISNFSLFVNGKQYQNEGLSLGMDHEKTSVMGYRTLFEGLGIHHSNGGHQITHDMFVNGYCMLLFDLTPDQGASEAHTSHPEQSNIRLEMKFAKPLPEANTCLLYLEYDNTVLIIWRETSRSTTKMETLQILCTLRNVKSFLDVYAFDLLPRSITKTCTVIVNADPHTKGGSH